MNSPLSKRAEIWGKGERAFNDGIIWGAHVHLFLNSCAPTSSPRLFLFRDARHVEEKALGMRLRPTDRLIEPECSAWPHLIAYRGFSAGEEVIKQKIKEKNLYFFSR